ncbi:transposase [Micromonospora sp. BRA006-A]|nr:transposase [Micromonospora sp. BRA006-A]
MQVAEAMVAAAGQQTVNLPGQRAAAVVVGQMATEILALEQRIAAVDDLIAEQLDQHPLAPIIGSLPGMGPLLTAELLVHTAGMTEYDSPTKLAAHAGLAPVSCDSGTVSGNHRQPRRYHRRLRHILWMAAFTAARECLPPAPTTRRNAPKGRTTGKPFSPSRDDASTSSGHSSATAKPSPTGAADPRGSLNQKAPRRRDRDPAGRFTLPTKINRSHMETP